MTLKRRMLFSLMGTGALAGCAAARLITPDPPRVFKLEPARALEEGLPASEAVLLIETPTAVAGLNSARIALRPEPSALDFYAGALWVDVVPVMVQQLTAETLAFSDRVQVVIPSDVTGGLRPSHSLNLYVLKFEAVYDEGTNSPPLVNLGIGARLLRLPRREQVAVGSFEEFERASGTSLNAIVAAFNRAADNLFAEVGAWTLRALADAA